MDSEKILTNRLCRHFLQSKCYGYLFLNFLPKKNLEVISLFCSYSKLARESNLPFVYSTQVNSASGMR